MQLFPFEHNLNDKLSQEEIFTENKDSYELVAMDQWICHFCHQEFLWGKDLAV